MGLGERLKRLDDGILGRTLPGVAVGLFLSAPFLVGLVVGWRVGVSAGAAAFGGAACFFWVVPVISGSFRDPPLFRRPPRQLREDDQAKADARAEAAAYLESVRRTLREGRKK